MKKILIVDDTQANLDAAKAFFSTIPGYEFVFATNRKVASTLLPDVDAVITDWGLPYSEDSSFGCEIPPSGHSSDIHPRYENNNSSLNHANGSWIMYKAYLSGKPVVMASAHGTLLMLIVPKAPQKLPWNLDEEYKKDFSLEKLLDDFEKNPRIELYNYLCTYQGEESFVWAATVRGLEKTSSLAWKMAWEEIQKQF